VEAAQATGLAAPTAHLNPAGHGVQATIPASEEKYPAGHASGATTFGSGQKLPCGQTVQESAPDYENVPAGQARGPWLADGQ